jgi:hypothetical protein
MGNQSKIKDENQLREELGLKKPKLVFDCGKGIKCFEIDPAETLLRIAGSFPYNYWEDEEERKLG